jgi:hypothetical protein
VNSNNFFSAVPGFVNGVHSLQNELITAAFVIAFAGLVVHACHAMVGRNVAGMYLSLVRLALIPIIILGLQSWGDLLVTAVNGLTSDLGANGNGANIFQAYQAAIALKLGSATAAANINQTNAPAIPVTTEGDMSGGFVQQPLSGVTLTHYAYPGDTTPDGNSGQGSGAFPFSSAPGSLIPMYSAALTASAAQQYNLSPGQSFSVTTTGGQTYNLVYADVVPSTYNGVSTGNRVDIYDPNNTLGGGDNFSEGITSINGGPVVAGQTGPASMLPNPAGSIGDQVLWAITLILCWCAEGLIWLMTIAQQLLYLLEIAISPVFVACLMVPALTHLARRFFLILVGICLWPLAWAVCNLVSQFLINLAVNPTNNGILNGLNTASVLTGPLAGLAYLLVVAVWVIGSTIAAPVFIGILLGAGGGATAAVFGATLGAAAIGAAKMGSNAVGGPSGVAALVGSIGSNGSNGSAPISVQSSSRMNGATQTFAKRPMNEQGA